MYNLSVIISIDDKNSKKCLDSILNQTLKNIEIICVNTNSYNLGKFYKNDIRIKLFHNGFQSTDVNGEYVIFIEDVISKDTCELLYNYAKSKNLDLLYVPKYNFLLENDFKTLDSNSASFIFTKLYKNFLFNIDDVNPNIINVDFFNKNLYSEMNFNPVNVEKYISPILKSDDKLELNLSFSILILYLQNFPLMHRQEIYDFIKNRFKLDYLNKDNQIIFNIILKNKYYLDFLIDFNLEFTEYDVYEGSISKNNNFKISIIIPIHNNETLIHRTLMSIENQSFKFENIEVIMINDASTDNTRNTLNYYSNKYYNFKAIHIKKGTGSAGTPRNIGLCLASAEYVMFLDHDDFFEIDALDKLYNKITKFDCDFVFGSYALIDNNAPIKFCYPNEKQGFFKSLEDNPKSITIPPSIWTKLFKKEFLLKNNILFPTILGEDAIFMSKSLAYANGVYYLGKDIICYYNLNEQSYTSNLSYNYFIEGLVSEDYMFNLFCDWNHKEYYTLRGQGILDYYLNRFMVSQLNNNEIKKLISIFYEFCLRLKMWNIEPKQERNKTIFNYILKKDVEGLIKFKNYKPNKIKVYSNKILNKINKHGFW